MRRLAALIVVLAACEEHGSRPPGGEPDGGVDPTERTCPVGRQKLKFEDATSCSNDGSVQFCAPDTAGMFMRLGGVSPEIACTPSEGGAARCNTPGLVLCFYPTRFPGECTTSHGAMTDEVWQDMCDLAEMQEIVEILPTIFEG